MNARQTSLWPPGWNQEQMGRMSRHMPTGTWTELDAQVQTYQQRMRGAVAHNEFMDTLLGELLVATARAILRDAERLAAEQQQWARMAIGHLICVDDGNDDVYAIDGLDDDAKILISFLEATGQAAKAQPIREHLHR